MSRSVRRTEVLPVPVCPTVQPKQRFHPLKETIKPLGENALPEEILRWLFPCFLVNTVVFLPLALRQRTHKRDLVVKVLEQGYSREGQLSRGLGTGVAGALPVPTVTAVGQFIPRLERRGLSWPFQVTFHSITALFM